MQEHLAEIKRYAKPDQTGSPKEKHAFYNNTKKKLDKSVIDSVESDQIIAHFRDD